MIMQVAGCRVILHLRTMRSARLGVSVLDGSLVLVMGEVSWVFSHLYTCTGCAVNALLLGGNHHATVLQLCRI